MTERKGNKLADTHGLGLGQKPGVCPAMCKYGSFSDFDYYWVDDSYTPIFSLRRLLPFSIRLESVSFVQHSCVTRFNGTSFHSYPIGQRNYFIEASAVDEEDGTCPSLPRRLYNTQDAPRRSLLLLFFQHKMTKAAAATATNSVTRSRPSMLELVGNLLKANLLRP